MIDTIRRYFGNIGSAFTRLLNSLLAGRDYREPLSSALGRKAAQERRLFIIGEAAVDLLFAAIKGERHHCANAYEQHRAASED